MNPFPYLNDIYTVLCILAFVIGGVWRVSALVSRIEKDLSDFKVEVANRYVTVEAIRQWKDDLKADITLLGGRLDRLLEKAG